MSEDNEWLNEMLNMPLEQRFADIADRYIGQSGQGHLNHQIDDFRLELAWYESDQGIHCQAQLFGPDGYQQQGSAVVNINGCRQELIEFIAEQMPDTND